MYHFIDTTAAGSTPLPADPSPIEAMSINGTTLESITGFRTLYVTGRESLAAELSSYENGSRDGAVITRRRFPSRTLKVGFQLICANSSDFRSAFNQLNKYLNVQDAEIVFADESDKHFVGAPIFNAEVEAGKNAVVGEFEIFCADPFKYGSTRTVQPTSGVFNVNYAGTYKAYPVLKAAFSADCGYVGFVKSNAVLSIGSQNEDDYGSGAYPASQALVTSSASDLIDATKWRLNDGQTTSQNIVQTGTVGSDTIQSQTVCVPSSYGTGANWHGPSLSKVLPADAQSELGALNWQFEFKLRFAMADKQTGQKGMFEAHVLGPNVPAFSTTTAYAKGSIVSYNGNTYKSNAKVAAGSWNASKWDMVHTGTKYIVAGVRINKKDKGKAAGLRIYIGSKTAVDTTINVTYQGVYFGYANKSVLNCSIIKSGNTFTFNLGGWKKSIVNEAMSNVSAYELMFQFAQNATNAVVATSALYYCNFIKDKCNTYGDIPNKFRAGGELIVDCNTTDMTYNNLDCSYLGALGNDWEQFFVAPGANTIAVNYSEWATSPTFSLSYVERFI